MGKSRLLMVFSDSNFAGYHQHRALLNYHEKNIAWWIVWWRGNYLHCHRKPEDIHIFKIWLHWRRCREKQIEMYILRSTLRIGIKTSKNDSEDLMAFSAILFGLWQAWSRGLKYLLLENIKCFQEYIFGVAFNLNIIQSAHST